MQHCPPEQLALAALREPLPADDEAHLASCADCRDEVVALRRAVDAVAVPELAVPGPPVTPPPAVWASIAAATGVTAVPRSEVAVAAAPMTAAPQAAAPVGEVLPLRLRRSRPLLLVAAAAIAGGVIGAGVMGLLRGVDEPEPVAAVQLDPLSDEPASGRAAVVVRDDGSRALQVDLDAPALDGRYYELWLIEPEVVDMVPLGILRPGTQTFELPAGLDLAEFPIVDVSVEPLDGDPTHSGNSVARGELDA